MTSHRKCTSRATFSNAGLGLPLMSQRRGSRTEGLTDPRTVKGGILGVKQVARQLAKDRLDSCI